MKKILLVILLALTVLPHLFAGHSLAQEAATTTARNLPLNTNSDVPQNFHTYTQNVFIEILSSAVCFTSGIDILTTDGRCLGVDPITKKLGYVTESSGMGLVGTMGNLIGSTFTLPASTGTYTQYLAHNFGITRTSLAQTDDVCDQPSDDPLVNQACIDKAAHNGSTAGFGQGVGFDALTPVLSVWKAFRNLTYLLFVVVFVILGLGIMFRLNIDARTVMTIQNQIPKIIVALILITFSYAIAGFLIDVMYLSIYLVVHVFDSQKLATVHNYSNPFTAVSGIGGINNIASPLAESTSSVVQSIFDGTFGGKIAKIVITIMGVFLGQKAGGGIVTMVGTLIGAGVGTVAAPGAGTAAGATIGTALGKAAGGFIGGAVAASRGPQIIEFVAGIIVYLVIVIAIITALFRTWISLIKAYVYILLDVIFAPIFIVGGLLPGASTGGFTSWIRSLLGNLAAFPTVFILFLVGASVQSQLAHSDAVADFSPPLLGNVVGGNGDLIASIIGLGIILIMPESVNLSKQFFKSPERKLASAAMGAVGVGFGAATKPFRNVWGSVVGTHKDGSPKPLTKRIQRLGAIPSALLGQPIEQRNEHGSSPVPWINLGRFNKSRIFPRNRKPKVDITTTARTTVVARPPGPEDTAGAVVRASAPTGSPTASSAITPTRDVEKETTRRVEEKFGSMSSAPAGEIDKIRNEVRDEFSKDDTSGV